MSSKDQDDHLLSITDEEEGEAMDTEIFDSSSHDGEQDHLVDETAPDQESTPKVTTAAEAV
jgi:hypothetical protein